uniref:Kazal-like domain-containing protein n=1 Tax=Seriola lalandi dorsalis TaxID=1841481 RepID=A0A3B4WF92_SERLL
ERDRDAPVLEHYGHNENPVCATDGNSYNNPCLVREASCMKQEQIDVKHLGRCPGKKAALGKLISSF